MIYYFGCWTSPGHFLHEPGGRTVQRAGDGPFNSWNLDPGYAPGSHGNPRHTASEYERWRLPYQDDTIAALVHKDGWTVLAMWDRSFDERYGCNASFIAKGEYTHAEMWALAREHYPQIVARLKAAPKLMTTGAIDRER